MCQEIHFRNTHNEAFSLLSNLQIPWFHTTKKNQDTQVVSSPKILQLCSNDSLLYCQQGDLYDLRFLKFAKVMCTFCNILQL